MYRYSHGIDVIKITADFNLVLWPIYCLCFFRYKLAVMNIIFSRFLKLICTGYPAIIYHLIMAKYDLLFVK